MTRQQHRHIGSFALILFAAGTIFAAPSLVRADDEPSFNDLRAQMFTAYKKADYKKSLELAEKMHELQPDNAEVFYSLACLHCLNGNKDKAYEWLEKSVDANYPQVAYLKTDDDFKTIRAEDRFRALAKKLAEMQADKAVEKQKTGGKVKKADDPAKQAEQIEDLDKIIEGLKKRLAAKETEVESLKAKMAELQKQQSAQEERPLNTFGITGPELNAMIHVLTQELVQASNAGERYKALAIALEARGLADVSLTNYNAACMYSLLEKKDEAFRYLFHSLELAPFAADMVAQIEADTDFDNIRDDARYKKVLEQAGKVRPQRARGEQGRAVEAEYKVTVPAGHDKSKKAPLIVALHGYGSNMEESIKLWKDAAAEMDAILLTPQGGFMLDNNAYHWGRSIDPIEENVLDAIDDVIEDYAVDTSKVVVTGFSQGGTVSWVLAIRNPDVFTGVIPVAGRPVGLSDGTFDDDELGKLRIFAMVGAEDQELIIDDNRETIKKFNEIGAKAELHLYNDVAHAFPNNAKEEQVKALKFVLAA